MHKEDYLMRQIDEFRDKAKQLQMHLKEKELQVMQLENMVNDREAQAVELAELLKSRRTDADQLVVQVSAQLQGMIRELDKQMATFQMAVGEQIQGVNTEFGQKVEELDQKLDIMKADIYDKIHTEDVKCYRNMKSLIEGQGEKMDKVSISDKSLDEIRRSFKGLKFFAFCGFLGFILLLLQVLYEYGLMDWLVYLLP